jgi:LPS-assembly lipoprotein
MNFGHIAGIHARRVAIISIAISGLSACGFKLRGAPNFAFKSLYSGFLPTSGFGNELKRGLESVGVAVSQEAAARERQDVALDVFADQREKIVSSVNAAGQTREFKLRVRLRFRLRTGAGRDLIDDSELLAERDISFAEGVVLAKEAEEQILFRDMQTDLVNQLMRRLAAVRL